MSSEETNVKESDRYSIVELLEEIDRIKEGCTLDQQNHIDDLRIDNESIIDKEDFERITESVWIIMKR